MKIFDVKQLISQGNTEAALQALQSLAKNSPRENEAALLSARFQKIQKEVLLGTADEAAGRKEINQINFAVLELLGSLPANRVEPNLLPVPKASLFGRKNFGHWIWWAIGLTVLLAAVYYFSKKRAPGTAQTFDFQYIEQGIPTTIVSKIDSLQKSGEAISYLAFGPTDKEWMIFYGRNKFVHSGNLSGHLLRKLDTLSRLDDAELKGLCLGKNSSFIAWFNANDFWFYFHSQNPVDSLAETLYQYYKENRELTDIAIAPDPDRSWVVLNGNLTYTFRAIEGAAYRQVLHDVVYEKHGKLKQFAFSKDSGEEWVLLYDFNSFEAGEIDPNLREKLLELQRGKREILKVFMRGQKEWVVFYK